MDGTLTTNHLGQIAIAKVELRAIEKGLIVSRPTLECRYDLVIDDGDKLFRTQVKYAGGDTIRRNSTGSVMVGLRKWRNGGRDILPYYKTTEIDLLLVYVHAIDRVVCFGPEVFDGRRFLLIRISPARNNQVKGCLMAADHIW